MGNIGLAIALHDQRQHIKTNFSRMRKSFHVSFGSSLQPLLFNAAYGFLRVPEKGAAAGFYLTEHQEGSGFGHQVYLHMFVTPVAGHYAVAFLLQVAGSSFLTVLPGV